MVMPPTKPDYSLGVMDKSNGKRGNIGAGWSNPDGSITLSLNPGVCLMYNPDIVPRLFPIEMASKGKGKAKKGEYREPEYEDDIDTPY